MVPDLAHTCQKLNELTAEYPGSKSSSVAGDLGDGDDPSACRGMAGLQLFVSGNAPLAASPIYLFGSVARGEEGPQSDIDILVDFQGPATFDRYMELKFYLEELFQRKVDLITQEGLRAEIRGYVEEDMIRAA